MPATKTIFMFSGQGSQYYDMGRALYEERGTFRAYMDRMDLIVRELVGHSIVEVLYKQGHTMGQAFDRILLSHPAIFMVEFALAHTLIDAGVTPDLTLGASLGTFAAVAISNVLNVKNALTTVVEQARLLEAICEPGAMIAVLGEPRLFEDASLHHHSELAAINFQSHFVVATNAQMLAGLEKKLKRAGVSYHKLPVPFGFHSQWIEGIKEPFLAHLQTVKTATPDIPLVCCSRSGLLKSLPEQHFWKVTRDPIRFHETIQHLEANGTYRYIDVGPGSTLSTFMKYCLSSSSKSQVRGVLSPFRTDLKNLAAVARDFQS